jgi:cyclic pyranopterin phosphate synthase
MKKVIPISALDALHSKTSPALIPGVLHEPTGVLNDSRGRSLQDLRISVTDRCNFRCPYCMPKEIFTSDYNYLGQKELLSFEEITRLSSIFIAHGVKKIRLTGGEPLLRKGIEELVAMLSPLQTLDHQPIDLTLTTNGSLLKKKAQGLKDAGLKRITISLDGIHDETFRKMNDVDFALKDVLESIDVAQKLDFESVKINMVVKKGVNDQEILPMIKHFKNTGVIVRFIEYMDVGNTNGWKMDEVIPSRQIIDRIQEHYPLTPIDPDYLGEVAQRWKMLDGGGEIGVISSVTQTFCHTCTRARISMEGKLFLCLFASKGYDLKALLRSEANDLTISNAIAQIWQARDDRYSEQRTQIQQGVIHHPKVEMSYIGG